MKRLALALAMGASLVPASALAHPDHVSGGDFGLAHFVSDPFHLLLTAGVCVLALACRRLLRRERQRL